MGIFSRTKKTQIEPETNQKKEPLESFVRLNDIGVKSQSELIDSTIRKQVFNYQDFQCNQFDEEGNYFTSEFNIQSTVGRLKSLYAREPWVYATASLIARTLSSLDFKVYDVASDKELPNHPLNNLVNKGNYINSAKARDWSAFLDLSLGGNFFFATDESYTQAFGLPIEYATPILREIRTEQDKKDIIAVGPIKEIKVSENNVMIFNKTTIPMEQIIHVKLPNPYNPFYGLPMYAAAARPILLDRYKNEFESAFYLRGGSNTGVIETEKDISRTRMERLVRTFEQAFTGRRNWWRQLFLPAGAKWVNSSLSMTEMQHLEGLRENRLTLLSVLGIPPSQVGIVQDVNRATSETQESAFWQNTIVPLSYFIASGWNNSFVVKTFYKNKVYVAPDLSGIEALEGSLLNKAEVVNQTKTVLTINELRELLNYPQLKETDPRGSMFVSEVERGFHVFSQDMNTDLLGPTPEESKALNYGTTEDSTGQYRHVHYAEWDNEGNGTTTGKVQGDGPNHTHEIKEWKVLAAGDDYHDHGSIKKDTDPKSLARKRLKAQVTNDQKNIEDTYTKKFINSFDQYLKVLFAQTRIALREKKDVASYLLIGQEKRLKAYVENIIPILSESMELGFTMGQRNTKRLTRLVTKDFVFSDVDENALDVIRERTRDDQRKILVERHISQFKDSESSIDNTRTEGIMSLIEEGLEQGKTTEEIAKTIEVDYIEAYRDQFFTIARTETLTAVSQGIAWNNEALQNIYTNVGKTWIHVGDVASNPDARKEHDRFEDEGKDGVVTSDFEWVNPTTGGKLRYPRDPQAPAGDTINCRCSMASVIMDGAQSRADLI